jgi:hypothetical protein
MDNRPTGERDRTTNFRNAAVAWATYPALEFQISLVVSHVGTMSTNQNDRLREALIYFPKKALTPWRKFRAHKLVVAQLVKKFPLIMKSDVPCRFQRSMSLGPIMSHMNPVRICSISILILSSRGLALQFFRLLNRVLVCSACYLIHASFVLRLFFDHEYGGDKFLRNVG